MKKDQNFEENIKKLETILSDLENSEDIDKNLKLYESGVKLYKNCRDYLDRIEKKITILNDSLNEKEFDD